MEFQTAKQIPPGDLLKVKYDLFILVAGYEQRSVYLPQNYNIEAETLIALAFEEKSKDLHRKNNDAYLLEKGFKFVTVSGEDKAALEPVFSELLKKTGKENIFILFDYSSMTKLWYSSIINFLISDSKIRSNVTVHFSYTPAVYNEPKNTKAVKFNERVSFPSRKNNDSSKPLALIIGLGLDPGRPEFIQKSLDPDITILMYADPASDIKYVQKVLKFNQEIIENTEVRNLHSYPLFDLEKTNQIITDLCMNLRVKYNVVIVPVGPKVLTLLALLLSSRFPDINVIRLSPGANAPAFERVPCSEPLIYSAEFISDEL
jgi:hypothetical protein